MLGGSVFDSKTTHALREKQREKKKFTIVFTLSTCTYWKVNITHLVGSIIKSDLFISMCKGLIDDKRCYH